MRHLRSILVNVVRLGLACQLIIAVHLPMVSPALGEGDVASPARLGRIRVGCGSLADSNGRPVAQEAIRAGGSPRADTCRSSIQKAEPPPLPQDTPAASYTPPAQTIEPQQVVSGTTAAIAVRRSPSSNEVHRRPAQNVETALPVTPSEPLPQAAVTRSPPTALLAVPSKTQETAPISLKVDTAGAVFALASGGLLLWVLRSGFAASMLLFGLPIWRDLDLLAVVESTAPGIRDMRAGDDAERLFSDTPQTAQIKEVDPHA